MNHACPKCGTTTTRPGRCTACARPENQRKAKRPGMVTVYHTPRWRTLRELVLHRDGHTCQVCGRRGNTAGHIHPFVDAKDPRAWDPTNVQCQCHACNGREAGLRLRHRPAEHAA